jgi:hypothetical protein
MNDQMIRLLRDRAATTDLWLDVSGSSMHPTIGDPGSVRIVVADAPRVGEIWAFVARDGSLVVHRCLRNHGNGWFGFRGDGLTHDDDPVRSEQLVGRIAELRDRRGSRAPRRSMRRVAAAQLRRVGKFTQRLRNP